MPRIIDVIDGGDQGGYAIDGGYVRHHFTVVILVEGDTQEDTPEYILTQTPGLPIVGSWLGGAKLMSRDAVPHGSSHSALLWDCTFVYDSKLDVDTANADAQQDGLEIPAEMRRPKYVWTSEQWEIAMIRDRCNNELVRNPVGQPYDITTTKPVATFSIERYEYFPAGYFDPSVIWDYVGYLNDSTWFGFPALTVKVASISNREEAKLDTTDPINPSLKVYHFTTYVLQIRSHKDHLNQEIGWNEEVPIVGTKEFRDVGEPPVQTLVRSMDRYIETAGPKFGFPAENAQPIEVYLDPTGVRLADQTDPNFTYWCRFPNRDLTPLNLDPSAAMMAAYAAGTLSDDQIHLAEQMAEFAARSGIAWESPLMGPPSPPSP